MIKIIFFDIDGTLLSHKTNCIPDSTKKAIEKLRANGIKVALATGRHPWEMDNLPMGGLRFDAQILLTGQLCLDEEKNIILENPIRDPQKLVKLFREKTIPMAIIERNEMYLNFVNKLVVDAHKSVHTPLPEVHDYDGGDILQTVVYILEEDEAMLRSKVPDLNLTRWSGYGVDLVEKGGSKVTGIQKILDYYGLDQSETMAFGDGQNDIDMLKYVQIGIAMGNASDMVKESADYVTDDIDEDGVYKALKQFGLL